MFFVLHQGSPIRRIRVGDQILAATVVDRQGRQKLCCRLPGQIGQQGSKSEAVSCIELLKAAIARIGTTSKKTIMLLLLEGNTTLLPLLLFGIK